MVEEKLWLKNPPPKLKLDAFKIPLYPFQQSGSIFLASVKNCILRDETGLGKTPQVLGAFNALHRKVPNMKMIVVAPASVAPQWISECEKFTYYNFINYSGPKKVRKNILEDFKTRIDVHGLVITYDLLRRDVDELIELYKLFPFILTLDEAQKVKNPLAKVSKAAKRLSLKSFGTKMLTATPIYNQVTDIYGLFKIIKPSMFTTYTDFLDQFTEYFMAQVNSYTQVPMIKRPKNLEKLKHMIEPYVFGRKKLDVAPELPELTFMEASVDLPAHHKAIYKNLEENQLMEKNGQVNKVQELAALTHLQRCSDSLQHLDKEHTKSHPKIDEIVRIIEEDFVDEKIIVYSKFTSSIDILKPILKKQGISVFTLDGRLSQIQRQASIESWRSFGGKSVLVISSAGGAGLNLQDASTIIFLNYPWSYGEILQIYGRIHRIGTKHKNLLIINVYANGTIDEQIREKLRSKQETFNKVFSEGAPEPQGDIL